MLISISMPLFNNTTTPLPEVSTPSIPVPSTPVTNNKPTITAETLYQMRNMKYPYQ
jgi:hypothetical protein